MNIISLFGSPLKTVVFQIRMFLAAILLRHEYKKNHSLQEFNALDSEDFIDMSVDVQL